MSYTVTKYPQGTFSWADAMSTDAAATKKFMVEVMGWTAKDMPTDKGPDYTMFFMGEHTVAGLGQMPPDMKGAPSHWNNYITVDNLDEAVAKADKLGGKVVMPTMDVMTAGRMAGITDPTGAMVMLWQPGDHVGAGIVNTAGAMGWNELMTDDLETAKKFYSDLLGWTYDEMPGGDGYQVIKNGDRMNGGMMTKPAEASHAPNYWGVYFTVENIKQTLEKAKAAEGKIIKDAFQAKGVGQLALIADPAGAIFTVIELEAEPDHWTE